MKYKELSNLYKKINKWYDKKTKVLTIRTRPFNTFKIFIDIISKTIINGKVLYVFCSDEEDYIKEKVNLLNESISENVKEELLEERLKCISIYDVSKNIEEYELVIFDDISLFSKVTNEYIRDAIESVYWKTNKIIIYSSEFIFPIGERTDFAYSIVEKPSIEPRVMGTRIKLEENIPLGLFEYFKWFKENKKIVLIMVPTEEKLNKVYNHYYNVLREIDVRVVRFNKSQSVRFIDEIIQGYSDSLFIITNCYGQYINNIPNINLVLLFADDLYYSYKKIVYLCTSIHNYDEVQSEAIMVSKELSEDMDKARQLTREFNKVLWEKEYLRL